MRRLLLALAAGVFPLLACSKLLDVDFDARGHGGGTVGPGGETGTNDGGDLLPDGGRKPDAGDAGPTTEEDLLALLRVRVGDSTGSYFTSPSWLYWTDVSNAGHGYRPADKTTRVLPSGIQYGNDDFVIVPESGSLGLTYETTTSAVVDTFSYTAGFPLALVDGVVSFDLNAVANTTIPKVWRSSQPGVHATSPAIAAVQPSVLGRGDDVVYLRDFATPTNIFVFSLPAATTTSLTMPFAPIAVLPVAGTLIVVRFQGDFIGMQLLDSGRDLVDAIAKATSDISADDRAPLDLPAAVDDWVVYSARAGILAFHPSDNRLVALQLRSAADNFTFDGVKAMSGAKAIAFTITTGPTGLYVLDVTNLLGL